MAFLSSLFQGSTPQPVSGPAISAAGIPKELAPYYKDILGKAQALYNEKTAEGFKPYTGPTIAEFTPEQQQAFTGIAGLQGQQAPVFDEAMGMTRSAAAPMTQEQLTSYMSPYQQAVTDIEKREATKIYEGQVQPQLAAQAAKIQPFGGSRQAILEGMASDTQQRLLGDIQAKGSQQSYQDAVSRFAADRQAQGQAGAQLAQMVPNQFKAQLGELGAMQTVGESKQAQTQTALDEAFRQYQLEKNYPYDIMSKYQSTVTGAPIATTQFAPPPAPAPSTAQTLLGGLGTLVGTYGAFGGKLPNVFGAAAGGGGIADIIYAADGTEGQTIFDKMTGGFKKLVGGVMRTYDKYGNILNLPELSEIAGGVKQIGQNIAEHLPEIRQPGPVDLGATMGVAESQTTIPKPINLYSEDSLSKMSAVDPGELSPEDTQLTRPRKKVIGPVQGPETITQYHERRQQELKDAIPYDPLLESAQNKLGADIAIEGIDKRILATARADEDIGIAAAEKLYLDASAKQKGKLDERAAGLTDQKTQEQWANVASFFARLGSASPRKGGIMGVLDVALQEAPQAIEAMGKTNAKIKEAKENIEDKQMSLETILRKEELGMKLSAVERKIKRRDKDNVKKHTDRLFKLEEDKLLLEARIAGEVNDVKPADMTALDGKIANMIGASIGGNGQIIGGKFLKGEDQPQINNIQKDAAYLLQTMGVEEYYTNPLGHESITNRVNALVSGKKSSSELKLGDKGYIPKKGEPGYIDTSV